MNALECIERISNTSLASSDLQYCFLDEHKLPFQANGLPARSNDSSTFVSLDKLILSDKLSRFTAVAVSIQASKICAVDIDHCLKKQNDFTTISDIGKDILNIFNGFGYVESSFSGFGVRILFMQPCIADYKTKYYLKNKNISVEYYQWDQPGRYVSVTGNKYRDQGINGNEHIDVITAFLDKYMKRAHELKTSEDPLVKDSRSIDVMMKKVKAMYLTNFDFQELWFNRAPGHGSNESERDYHLVAELYEHVSKDPEKIMQIFKESPFYKSKDSEHIYKFNRSDNKYFWYLFNIIRGKTDSEDDPAIAKDRKCT